MKRPCPAKQAQVYRAQLYEASITYWETRSPSLQIKPKCTELYYSKPVEPIEKWGGPHPLIKSKCTEPYYTKEALPTNQAEE